MVRSATLADFQRHLDEIIHQGERDARGKVQDVRAYAAQHGAPRSNRIVISVYEDLSSIHSNAIRQMLSLVDKYRKIAPSLEVEALIPTISSRMSQLQEGLLAMPSGIALPQDNTRLFNQYASIFRQRLEHAIKDIEIGFFESDQQESPPIKDSDRRLKILQTLYARRYEEDWMPLPIDPAASQQERRAEVVICRQLRNARLIEFKQPVEDSVEGVTRITELGVDVVEGNAKPLIALGNQPSDETFSNFAPGTNFSNFRFAPDNNFTDSSQAPDDDDDEISAAENSDQPSHDRTIVLDKLAFLAKLEDIENGLRQIKPLVDLYSQSKNAHGSMGHNGPPEPIEPSPLSLDEYERAIEATAALREEISLEKPKPAVLRLGRSVLRRTWEGIKALTTWATGHTNKLVGGAIFGAGKVYGEEYAKQHDITTLAVHLENNLSELITQIGQLLHSLIG